MPLLTPEHDALADTWLKVTLAALKAKDPAALKAGMDAYVAARHHPTPVDVFWKYPWHYTNNQEAEVLEEDNFVNGATLHDEGDHRFRDVLQAALNPDDYWGVQVELAKLLGRFVLCSSNLLAWDSPQPQWEDELSTLMSQPGFKRYDLVFAFYLHKGVDVRTRVLQDQPPYDTLRSLYNWLLMVCASLDDDDQPKGARWYADPIYPRYRYTTIYGLSDEKFRIRDQNDDEWLQGEVLPNLHAVMPCPEDSDDDEDATFATNFGGGFPHHTAYKLQVLLTILAEKLDQPMAIKGHVRHLRFRTARVGVRIIQMVVALMRLKSWAKARVQARYEPMRVDGPDGLPGNGCVVPAAMLQAYQSDGF